jgi:predicted methyltransferase
LIGTGQAFIEQAWTRQVGGSSFGFCLGLGVEPMKTLRALLPLAALALAAPLCAKPADYARVVADPARSEDSRKLDESRQPAQVLDFLALKPGAVVFDFMAGGGYYTQLLAHAVGPKGVVYAMNPPGFHDAKEWEKGPNARPNIRTLVQPIASAQLAPGSVDMVFAHLTYHDLYWESEKYNFPRNDVPQVLAGWFRAVKPGGQVVIVDHVGPAGKVREVVEKLHRIDPEQVKADMAAAGFVLEGESSVLRRSEDDHAKNVFDPSVRGKTDRIMLKFRHP